MCFRHDIGPYDHWLDSNFIPWAIDSKTFWDRIGISFLGNKFI